MSLPMGVEQTLFIHFSGAAHGLTGLSCVFVNLSLGITLSSNP